MVKVLFLMDFMCCLQSSVDTDKVANTTIGWCGSSGVTHYDTLTGSEDSYPLIVDYSETGPVAIAVTLSSHDCSTTSFTEYFGRFMIQLHFCSKHPFPYTCYVHTHKQMQTCSCTHTHTHTWFCSVERVLTGVSLKDKSLLVIESRDCIASPEHYTYRILVASTNTQPTTELVTTYISPIIEHDVGDLLEPGAQYTVRVELLETTSGITIDVINTTILYSADESSVTGKVLPIV